MTFLREDIDYQVYIALMTLNEKTVGLAESRISMLEDKHYPLATGSVGTTISTVYALSR